VGVESLLRRQGYESGNHKTVLESGGALVEGEVPLLHLLVGGQYNGKGEARVCG